MLLLFLSPPPPPLHFVYVNEVTVKIFCNFSLSKKKKKKEGIIQFPKYVALRGFHGALQQAHLLKR